MEYLDPKKQRRYRISLWLGYTLVAIGIAIACVILIWQADGYGYKNGQVIQSGMVFLSSQPNPASIYINGKLNPATTNTRLTMNSGIYNFSLSSPGYKSWNHLIDINGGEVVHYDYPLLFPNKLNAKTIAKYTMAPSVVIQSPNQQYLVVSSPVDFNSFIMYDLTNPKTPPLTLVVPGNLVSASTSTQSWKAIGWANDNKHLLLEHIYSGGQEFIELDTQDPTSSINLNQTFNQTLTNVSLNNLNYDQYHFFDQSTGSLYSASLSNTKEIEVVKHVIAYKSYQDNIIIYTTSIGAPTGKVAVNIDDNNQVRFLRDLPVSQSYLLNMAGYNGDDYTVIGSSSDKFIYLYKDVLATIANNQPLTSFMALHINNPTYESFSPNTQFIMIENLTNFVVYDIQNDSIYRYATTQTLDSPQTHAQWMDGDRLYYINNAKITVADYDNTNRHTLTSALPAYLVFFAPDYNSYFSISNSSSTAGSIHLNQISLVAKP